MEKRANNCNLLSEKNKYHCNNPSRENNEEKIPPPDPSKFVPESLLRNEIPRDVSTNKKNNIENESDDEEIDTQKELQNGTSEE